MRGALALVDLVFDTHLVAGSSPRWLRVTGYTLAGIWLVSGLAWLAGALIAGYREPKAK
jgi:hypothetical protein